MRVAALAIALALVACKRDKDAPSSKKLDEPEALALPAKPVPAGSLVQPPFYTDFTIIVPEGTDPELGVAAVREAAKARGLDVRTFDQRTGTARGVVVGVDTPEGGGVSLDELDNIGTGLAVDDIAAIRGATQAVRVGTFAIDDAARTLRDGVVLARAAAAATKGWIYDSSLTHVFSRATFDEQFPDDVALSAPKIIMVGYERADDGSISMSTIGLRRLGLPELVVEGVPSQVIEHVLVVVNAAAQVLIDRGQLARDGELAIDVMALTMAPWPGTAERIQKDGGTGKLTWTATWDTAPDALGGRRLIALSLPGDGAAAERLLAALDTTLGGFEESVTYHEGDNAELAAAAKRAREALAKLRPTFEKGIPHGERLIVKAPFPTDDGSVEWMWVDVQRWKGDTITGTLLNRPERIAGLPEGARVEVKLPELADYIHTRADGSEAGGASIEILNRMDDAAQ